MLYLKFKSDMSYEPLSWKKCELVHLDSLLDPQGFRSSQVFVIDVKLSKETKSKAKLLEPKVPVVLGQQSSTAHNLWRCDVIIFLKMHV